MMISNQLISSTPLIPAPWQLTGDGYVLAYQFPRAFVEQQGWLPPIFASSFVGGFGAVMLVDYHRSDAGPYRELLFTPGQFEINGQRFYSITKIYVSTWASVVNGRQNWGIPKEFADFNLTSQPDGSTRVEVSRNGQDFADFVLKTGRLSLPVTTAIIPAALRTLIEMWDEKTYFTTPNGHGQVRPARLVKGQINPSYFPNVTQFQPVAGFRASCFNLEFPIATIKEGHDGN